jgi:hypothetical protein
VSSLGVLHVDGKLGGGIMYLWYSPMGRVAKLELERTKGSELVGEMWLREERPLRRASNG